MIETADVLLFDQGMVLLVRHEKGSGHRSQPWGLPGGRREEGECLEETAARELFEETGIHVDSQSLERLPSEYRAEIKGRMYSLVVFLARAFDGELRPSVETTPQWVSLADVAALSLLPNVDLAIQEGLEVVRRS